VAGFLLGISLGSWNTQVMMQVLWSFRLAGR